MTNTTNTAKIVLCALIVILTCCSCVGQAVLVGAFAVSGYATRHEEVTPSWQCEWPELPYHRHIETREVEGPISSRGLWAR
jgi:hypothetical protein